MTKYLQNDPAGDQERLTKLEWRLLPLARHNDFAPKTLHAELGRNPGFFAEVIAAQFRAKGEPRDEQKLADPRKQALAEAAHDLLDSWVGIPGTRADGSIDFATLKNWVDDSRQICEANDRLEICDVMLGEQFSCAPPDPDGTWHCAITNTTDAGAIAKAAIDALRDEHFVKARAEGRRESMEAYAAAQRFRSGPSPGCP